MSDAVEPYHLRRFLPDDWQVYRAIRLEALQTESHFFGSGYEEELKETEEQWRKRLSHPVGATWGLFYETECVGLTGISPLRKETDTLLLRSSYIRREHRGRGISGLFYTTRIEWAKTHGYSRLIVYHREGNEASKAANQKFGFQYTHTERMDWPDGSDDGHICYELVLDQSLE